MHVIKSAARKQAWYHNNDPDSSRTYNFFGRPNRNPRTQRDVESGTTPLNHVQSENDARSPQEQSRISGWNHTDTKRAGTYPTQGPSHGGETNGNTETPLKEKELSDGSDAVSPTATAVTEDGNEGTRKRRKFHLPHFGKNKDKDAEKSLDRTDTKKSSKSKKGKKQSKLTTGQQLKVIFMSWINILLLFVPVGLAFEYANLNGPATFVMNFIAIIPLAALLSFATEELALYVGETFGGLLNASFGNATELIVSIIALTQGKIIIVQTSLIGSMLSNLLLVLGMCFFFGGINRLEQFFNITVAQAAASLLALAIGALVTPTAFRIFSDNDNGVTPTSRAAAVLLLFTYVAYLFFQLRTHIEMYNTPSQKSEKQNLIKKKPNEHDADAGKSMAVAGAGAAAAAGGQINKDNLVQNGDRRESVNRSSNEDDDDDDDDNENEPQLSFWIALTVLAASTALIAVTSDGMVSAIDSITEPRGPISEEFVGLILVPIVGNAAEHATAVTVAIKDKMDLAIGVAVGSSLQIALLVIPVMVLLSWMGVGQPAVLNLNFDGFQVVVLFIAIILVNYVIQDGRSNWLEGLQLFITYLIFAVAAWYYPASSNYQN